MASAMVCFLVHSMILLKLANTIWEPSLLNSAMSCRNSFFMRLCRVLRRAGSYSRHVGVRSHLEHREANFPWHLLGDYNHSVQVLRCTKGIPVEVRYLEVCKDILVGGDVS